MAYYKNSSGAVAKVLNASGRVVVMVGFRTVFFDTVDGARLFLWSRGYYKN